MMRRKITAATTQMTIKVIFERRKELEFGKMSEVDKEKGIELEALDNSSRSYIDHTWIDWGPVIAFVYWHPLVTWYPGDRWKEREGKREEKNSEDCQILGHTLCSSSVPRMGGTKSCPDGNLFIRSLEWVAANGGNGTSSPPSRPPLPLSPFAWSIAMFTSLLGFGSDKLDGCCCGGRFSGGRCVDPGERLTVGVV